MKISGSGSARQGMASIRRCVDEDGEKKHGFAEIAISILHDGLLAVAKGEITPQEAKDFFWGNDFSRAEYFGDILTFEKKNG